MLAILFSFFILSQAGDFTGETAISVTVMVDCPEGLYVKDGYCCLLNEDRCCSVDPHMNRWAQCDVMGEESESMDHGESEDLELELASMPSSGMIPNFFDYSAAGMGMVCMIVFGFFVAGYMYGEVKHQRRLAAFLACQKTNVELNPLMNTPENETEIELNAL